MRNKSTVALRLAWAERRVAETERLIEIQKIKLVELQCNIYEIERIFRLMLLEQESNINRRDRLKRARAYEPA